MDLFGKELPHTYIQVTRRIDFGFISRGLISALKKADQIDTVLKMPYWTIYFDSDQRFLGTTESLSLVMQTPFTMRKTKKLEKLLGKFE